jgi:hypothetical protein
MVYLILDTTSKPVTLEMEVFCFFEHSVVI